jgi:hypothetical protein
LLVIAGGWQFVLDKLRVAAEYAAWIKKMTIVHCLMLVAALGAAGGLTACIHKDAVVLPKYDKRAKSGNQEQSELCWLVLSPPI